MPKRERGAINQSDRRLTKEKEAASRARELGCGRRDTNGGGGRSCSTILMPLGRCTQLECRRTTIRKPRRALLAYPICVDAKSNVQSVAPASFHLPQTPLTKKEPLAIRAEG